MGSGSLPFLDTFIHKREDRSLNITVYRNGIPSRVKHANHIIESSPMMPYRYRVLHGIVQKIGAFSEYLRLWIIHKLFYKCAHSSIIYHEATLANIRGGSSHHLLCPHALAGTGRGMPVKRTSLVDLNEKRSTPSDLL